MLALSAGEIKHDRREGHEGRKSFFIFVPFVSSCFTVFLRFVRVGPELIDATRDTLSRDRQARGGEDRLTC